MSFGYFLSALEVANCWAFAVGERLQVSPVGCPGDLGSSTDGRVPEREDGGRDEYVGDEGGSTPTGSVGGGYLEAILLVMLGLSGSIDGGRILVLTGVLVMMKFSVFVAAEVDLVLLPGGGEKWSGMAELGLLRTN